MLGPRAGKISRFAKDGSTTCGPKAGRQAELYPAAGNVIDQLDGNSSLRSESEMNYPDVHPNSNLAKNSAVKHTTSKYRSATDQRTKTIPPQGIAAEKQFFETKAWCRPSICQSSPSTT